MNVNSSQLRSAATHKIQEMTLTGHEGLPTQLVIKPDPLLIILMERNSVGIFRKLGGGLFISNFLGKERGLLKRVFRMVFVILLLGNIILPSW